MEKCLSVLKSSNSDNEKFAALLLVAKSIKSDQVDAAYRRRIFDSVGFSFINRLLITTEVPPGCDENVYRSLALTLLACYSTDPELALHPQVAGKTAVVAEVLADSSSSEGQVVDALQCMLAQAAVPSGRQQLVRHGGMEALAKRYLLQKYVSPQCVDLLLGLVSCQGSTMQEGEEEGEGAGEGENGISQFVTHFNRTLLCLSTAFKTDEDAFKFELLKLIGRVMLQAQSVAFTCGPTPEWVELIAFGLRDILRSRIGPEQRNPALQLASILCQHYSVGWTLLVPVTERSRASFTYLLMNLVSVEVHMALEGDDLQEVATRSDMLSHCFSMMEQCILFTAAAASDGGGAEGSGNADRLSEEDLLQLHSALTEGLSCVIKCLQDISVKGQPPEELMGEPLVLALIRVLGAWLAEESLALSEDVFALLPFLLHLTSQQVAAECRPSWQGKELWLFLLPGLCHLTAEDKPREVLLKAQLHVVLKDHFQDITREFAGHRSEPSDTHSEHQIALCCSVFQNLCVCEPKLVEREPAFMEVLDSTVCSLMQEGGVGLETEVNLVFLALMIVRRKGCSAGMTNLGPFLAKVTRVVMECLKTRSLSSKIGTVKWKDVSEAVLLTLQELTALLQSSPACKAELSACPQLPALKKMMVSLLQRQRDDDGSEVLQRFLTELPPNTQ